MSDISIPTPRGSKKSNLRINFDLVNQFKLAISGRPFDPEPIIKLFTLVAILSFGVAISEFLLSGSSVFSFFGSPVFTGYIAISIISFFAAFKLLNYVR